MSFRKLTPEIELKLCDEYLNSRISEQELSEKYGVSKFTIREIRKRNNIPKRKRNAPRQNLITLNERYFENIDTEDKAYWLGFIAADGCIKERNNNYILSVGLGQKDLPHLEKLKKCLKYEGDIHTETSLHSKTKKYYTTVYLRVARTILCEDLIKAGVGRDKSQNLQLPDLSDDLMRHYIRGLVDGDGSWFISKNYLHFDFISSIEKFAISIMKILMEKCQLNETKIYFYRNSYSFRYAGYTICRRIFDYLYKDSEIYLDRKYKLCDEYCNPVIGDMNE